jgi:Tol biopolymer transport system component
VRDLVNGTTERASVGTGGTQASGGGYGPSISSDGRFVAFQSGSTDLVPGDTNGHADVFVHDRLTGSTVRVSVNPVGGDPNSSSNDPSISADGRYVAYVSNESGQDEVYVRPFSMNAAETAVEASGKWPISSGGGYGPLWRGDSRELYYRSADGRLMAVEIATQLTSQPGKPQPLGLVVPPGAPWDSTTDGKRFFVITRSAKPEPYTVVLNWQTGLSK